MLRYKLFNHLYINKKGNFSWRQQMGRTVPVINLSVLKSTLKIRRFCPCLFSYDEQRLVFSLYFMFHDIFLPFFWLCLVLRIQRRVRDFFAPAEGSKYCILLNLAFTKFSFFYKQHAHLLNIQCIISIRFSVWRLKNEKHT